MDGNADNVDEQKSRVALTKFFHYGKSQDGVVKDNCISKILDMLKPQCQCSMETTGHKCLKLYEEEKAKMKVILRNLDGQVSLSVDILRSGKNYMCGSEYLCLTAHFIDDNWELRRCILNFSLIGLEGEGLFHKIILNSLKDWDIESKIFTITMLNSNRYDESLEIVKNHIHGKKELQLNDQLFRVHCCADIVKLMVLDAYEAISDIVDQIGNKYKFKEGVPTWENRSNQLKESFYLQYVPKEIREYYELPSKKGWNRVSSIVDLVDDIYQIVFPLLELGYPTSNIFLHQLQELQSYLTKRCITANGPFMRSVTEKMLEKLNKYMKDMYLVMSIASVLDPCFKLKYIEFSSSKFEGDDVNSQFSYVLETLSNLYDEYVTRFSVTENIAEDPDCNIEDDIGLQLLREYKQFIQSSNQPIKSELTCYLEDPVLPWSQDFNALSWWKAEILKYPVLARMARDFLAIPISITIKGDAFYMKQRKADYCIITLKPDLMNAFMCIRSWFLEA